MKTRQCTWNRGLFGIVNAQGGPWTYRVFDSEARAQAYLGSCRAVSDGLDLSRHRVVRVSITVRVLKTDHA